MIAQAKLYIAGAALLALILLGWWLRHSGYTAGENACKAAMADAVAQATSKAIETETAAKTRVESLETAHAAETADLDARYRAALDRLQKRPAGSRSVPQASPDAGKRDADGDGRGLPGAHDPDPRPVLVLYARDAERLRLALKTCQQYGIEIERFRANVR